MIKTIIIPSILLTAFNTYSRDLYDIDLTIDPGQNFFLYANNSWIKQHPIPSSEAEWGVFNVLQKNVDLQIKQMLMNLPKHPKLYQKNINKQLHRYFVSGLDTQTIEKENIKPLLPYLKAIHEVNDLPSFIKIFATLHQIDIAGLFSFENFDDLHQQHQIIGNLNQPALILPDRSYYLAQDQRTLTIQKAYQQFIESLFIELGYNEENAHQAYLDTWNIEKQLALFSKEKDFFRTPSHIDHLMSIDSFKQNYPHLNLNRYFKEIKMLHTQKINVANPNYFKQLNTYLPKLSKEQMHHYLTSLLLSELSGKLSKNFATPYCDFAKAIRGFQKCPERWEQIINSENYYLGYALGDLYVSNYSNPETIRYVKDMVDAIRTSLRKHLQSISWLSEPTKRQAMTKLNKMGTKIGYPRPLDYSNLNIHSDVYVENVIEARRFETRRQWNKIGTQSKPSEWDMPPQSINAYYSVSQNQINIPLGILQAPFFSKEVSNAANFGGIGVVIGHEMFHGFDDEGSQFDANGIFKRWWTTQEWQQYEEQVKCISEQYSAYPIHQTHLKVNGKLVSGEAIADLGGVMLALDAYMHSEYKMKDKVESGITPIQQFFIQFARIWASSITTPEAQRKGLTDPHPPKEWRVNGTLYNIPEFYQAFSLVKPKNQCKLF